MTSLQEEGTRAVRGFRIAYLVLCTIGACLSTDLIRLHINVHTDPNYHSYCAMSERVNCDTVATSEYAVFLHLPLAVWGLLAYLLMGGLAIWGLRSRLRTRSWPFGLLFAFSLFSSVVSIALLCVSHFIIESVCVVCLSTYVVNLALLFVSLAEVRRGGDRPFRALADELRSLLARPLSAFSYFAPFGAALVILWAAVPPYWGGADPPDLGGLASGATPAGHPWIGAETPAVEIVEFSDYQCPHCRRGHEEMRRMVKQHPDKLRLVHRNYPLDQGCNPVVQRAFHPHACTYARLAHCAARQGQFWAANDYLFANGSRTQAVTAEELAQALRLDRRAFTTCVSNPETSAAIAEDLAEGRSLKVRGTPTFVIGDQTYPGRVPTDVVEAALSRAVAASASTP